MDDEKIKHWDYSSFGVEYAPPDHAVRIGSGIGSKGSSGFQCPRDITFSNVRIVAYEENTPPTVVSVGPSGSKVPLGSDVIIRFSEAMDREATEAAFSIEPVVSGRIEWSGGTMYFNPDGLLLPNTQYSVSIATSATDLAGHSLASAFNSTFRTEGASVPDRVKRVGAALPKWCRSRRDTNPILTNALHRDSMLCNPYS